MVHKTPKELAQLTPAELKQYEIGEANAVFGVGHKHDREGNPIEQGMGSYAHPTLQDVVATERYYTGPDKAEVVAAKRKRLEEFQAEQKAKRVA